jgi:phage FluMu gp28-like protein
VDGWLDPDEIERKRLEIPAQMWKNEYDILEPNFEGRGIDESAVERMFEPQWEVVDGKEGYYYQFLKPRPDRDYVTGVDWAKSRDFTVIVTWDTTVLPWKLAAFEKINRRPWPSMVARLNKRWAMYGGKVVSDATGIGSVVNDYIEYPKGAYRSDLTELTMAGRIRSEMVTEVVQAVENADLLAPRIKSMYDDFRFVTPDDLYNNTQSAHLPDTIAATALAWTARKRETRSSAAPISLTRENSPWRI